MKLFKKGVTKTDDVAASVSATEEVDIDSVMKKYDRDSNIRIYEGIPRSVIRYLLTLFALYSIYINFFANWETRIERASFVGIAMFMIFLLFPAKRGGELKPNYIPWYDLVLACLSGFSYFYFVFNCRAIIEQGIALSTFEVIVGVIGILVTLEACRRSVGVPIVLVAGGFIIYALTQKKLFLNVYNLFYTTEGVIGTPIRACSTFIVLFVIFGSFLEKTGIAQFFIDFANSLCGSSIGGPAKAAVVASALEGMASGSSVANTVGSGSVTIPMMKRLGYKPEFAAAVEAAASTGGQIMPPIMGAAAFLMIEYTGYSYAQTAMMAILPAVLYFAGIFIIVHLEAKKLGLKGIPREELPNFWKLLLHNGYLLIPLIALVYLITAKTITFAAIVATGLAILVSMFRKDTRMNLTRIIDALEGGARSILSIAAACAAAGVVACVITTTGIGNKLITLIVGISGETTILALMLTMITCIILGMGVPTTANYVIMATTCAPILIKMGIDIAAAHMFVFYFGIVADITPPVALAAYAGSAIAKSDPIKTAVNATKLAIAAFIVPYIFALNPTMLLINAGVLDVIQIVLSSLIGMFGISMGLEGYESTEINWPFRIASIAGGLFLIYPGTVSDLIGLVLVAGVFIYNRFLCKKKAA